jgi:hypothetical protein
MEAELATLDTATVDAEWLRELLMDLPVVEKPIPAILMNCDNLSGTIIRGTLKAPNSQLVTPISIKLQRPDECD